MTKGHILVKIMLGVIVHIALKYQSLYIFQKPVNDLPHFRKKASNWTKRT